MDKLIIYVATGFPDNANPKFPAIPATNEKLIEEAIACREAGASIVHFHGPHDPKDRLKLIPDKWGKMAEEIRKASGLLIDFGQAGAPWKERKKLLKLGTGKPDFMGVSLTSHDYRRYSDKRGGYDVSYHHPRPELVEYAATTKEYGVKPNWEVWWLGGLWNFNYLEQQGLIEKPYWFNLLFGTEGEVWSPATMKEVNHRIDHMPKGSHSLIAPRNKNDPIKSLHLHTLGIMRGCHVRVGAQDIPYFSKGKPAKSNVELVSRIARIAKDLGRQIATPDDVRKMLKLPGAKAKKKRR